MLISYISHAIFNISYIVLSIPTIEVIGEL